MGVKERIGAFLRRIVGNLPNEEREALLRNEEWVRSKPPERSGEINQAELPLGTNRDWR